LWQFNCHKAQCHMASAIIVAHHPLNLVASPAENLRAAAANPVDVLVSLKASQMLAAMPNHGAHWRKT
jgi:hypothetical protein